jgi:HAD superfamily hydrolase (TIGR01509 family)
LTSRETPQALAGAPVEGVLFDYGNTLVWFDRPDDALRDAYSRIAAMLRGKGVNSSLLDALLTGVHKRVDEEFAAHMRSGALEEIDLVAAARAAYRDAGVQLSNDELDQIFRWEQEAWWQGARVDPEAVATLQQLRREGVRVGLCSNAPYRARSMHDQLVYVGLRDHLDSVTFSGEVGWRKPSPRIFAEALAALGTTAERTVMVGDTERDDIAGARAAGMRTVLARTSPDTSAHLNSSVEKGSTAADAVIGRLAEMVWLLRRGAG